MSELTCSCGGIFILKEGMYRPVIGSKRVEFSNSKILMCNKCEKVNVPSYVKRICDTVLKSLNEDEIPTNISFERVKQFFFEQQQSPYIEAQVDFLFDIDDYYFIPGLSRPWNRGFLTPVFFNIEVLLKYSRHPRYSLELGANTLGSIYMNHEHLIEFGINSNGKVIMWLGDISNLNIEEQYYLRSENVVSDHNIASEFFEAQIEVEWAESSNEKQLLKSRLRASEKALMKLNTTLSQLEPETIKIASKIKRPLIESEETFSEVIIPMNKVFVESLNTKSIKKNIKLVDEAIDLTNKGGLKLLELWLENVLNHSNSSALISPLFVLYDLRMIMAHLQSLEREDMIWSRVCERLNLERDNRNYLEIFDALIESLNNMYCEIEEAIDEL